MKSRLDPRCLPQLLFKKQLQHSIERRSARWFSCCQSARYKNATIAGQDNVDAAPFPPSLSATCQQYTAFLQPLISSEELQKTTKTIETFIKTEGQELQNTLVQELQESPDGMQYFSELLTRARLRQRDALPVRHSEAVLFSDGSNAQQNGQIITAANVIISSVRYMQRLEDGFYDLETSYASDEFLSDALRYLPEGEGLDMAMLKIPPRRHVFKVSRIPKETCDEISQFKACRHVAVIRNGHVYTIRVLEDNGSLRAPEDLLASLSYVANDPASATKAEFPVAALTSQERDTWANNRFRLVAAGNGSALQAIDRSILLLVLEDKDDVGVTSSNSIRSLLHGGQGNRWYDKPLNWVIRNNGGCGVFMDTSWSRSSGLHHYLRHTVPDFTDRPTLPPDAKASGAVAHDDVIKKLDFTLTDYCEKEVSEALGEHRGRVNSLQLETVDCGVLGSSDLEGHGICPDAAAHLVFQMAYKRFFGHVGSASHASSWRSLTGSYASVAIATRTACEAFETSEGRPPADELKKLLLAASHEHSRALVRSATDVSFHDHLLVLRELAEEHRLSARFFRDTSFTMLTTPSLQTASTVLPGQPRAAIGPTSQGGLGIAYQMLEGSLRCTVTFAEERDVGEFCTEIEKSADAVRLVL